MRALRRTALALFPLLALTACGGGGSSSDVSAGGTVAAAGPATAQTAQVDGEDTLKFAPNVVTARTGTLDLTMKNAGGVSHNLVFDAKGLGMTGTVEGGRSQTLKLRFDKAGTYTFQCTFHEHMTGKVVVS
jgi:plastocyanin